MFLQVMQLLADGAVGAPSRRAADVTEPVR